MTRPIVIHLSQGTHEELMRIPEGGYARLVAAQMGAKGGVGASPSKPDLMAAAGVQ